MWIVLITNQKPGIPTEIGVDNSVDNFKFYPHNSKTCPHFELFTFYTQVIHRYPVDNQCGCSVRRITLMWYRTLIFQT